MIFHFPFVLPFRNLYHAHRLVNVRFGRSEFDPIDSSLVEAIQKEVGLAGLYESFFEAGPQSGWYVWY